MNITRSNINEFLNIFCFVSFFAWVILFICNRFLNINQGMGGVIFIFGLVISSFVVLKMLLYKQKSLLIFALFLFSYVYNLRYYFLYNKDISYHQSFNSEYFYNNTALIHILFLITLLFCINHPYFVKKKEIGRISFIVKDNCYIFMIVFALSVLIFLLGRSGETLMVGAYGKTDVEQSSFNEYFIVTFLVAYLFSGLKNWRLILLYILALVYVIKNILYGGRIEALQIALLLFCLILEHRITIKKLIILFVLGLYIVNLLARIRENPLIIVNENWLDIVNPFNFESGDINSNNQGDVFQSSVRLYGLVDTGIIGNLDRAHSFLLFFCSIFLPFSWLPPLANLSTYFQNGFSSGGGGLISSYFYVWLSIPGVILIAVFVSYILSKYQLFKYNSLNVYTILFVSTFPRWMAYNPIIIFKLCVYGLVFYILCNSVHVSCKSKKLVINFN